MDVALAEPDDGPAVGADPQPAVAAVAEPRRVQQHTERMHVLQVQPQHARAVRPGPARPLQVARDRRPGTAVDRLVPRRVRLDRTFRALAGERLHARALGLTVPGDEVSQPVVPGVGDAELWLVGPGESGKPARA